MALRTYKMARSEYPQAYPENDPELWRNVYYADLLSELPGTA